MQTLTLDKLAIGQKQLSLLSAVKESCAAVFRYGTDPKPKSWYVKSPLGDPIEIFLRGYELTLRLDDANKITVAPEEP